MRQKLHMPLAIISIRMPEHTTKRVEKLHSIAHHYPAQWASEFRRIVITKKRLISTKIRAQMRNHILQNH